MKMNTDALVYIYVIDYDDNILYMNDHYREAFHVEKKQQECHEVCKNSEKPSSRFVVDRLKKQKSEKVQYAGYNKHFDCIMAYSAYAIKWEGTDAIMIAFNKENELNKHLYDNELKSNAYDELFELDIRNNAYRLIYHVEDKYVIPKAEGKLDEVIVEIAQNMIYHEDKQRFLDFWNLDNIKNELKSSKVVSADFRKLLVDGSYIWASLIVVSMYSGLTQTEDECYLCFVQDINKKQKTNTNPQDINALTGLYRGSAFYYHAEQRIFANQEEYMILYIDIEHFKLYNDWYGHEQGDCLLKEIAVHLKAVAKTVQGICGYFGGDDYVLLAPVKNIDLQKFEEQAISWIGDQGINSGFLPSIGVYYVDVDEPVSITLMCDRAAIAANSIKGNYSTRVAYYERSMKQEMEREHEVLLDVKRALDNEEFKVYLQPKYNMFNDKIVGFEALVRWHHSEKGIIYPNDFIPILENNGFIMKLDLYMWDKTCALLREWIDKGYQPVPISVNISRIDLFHIDVVTTLNDLIQKYKLNKNLLELEITESAYAKDMDTLLVIIKRLRTDGFKVLMDDFGSGYSSLNMLKDIEIDTLKIDMRFLFLDEQSKNKGIGIIESIVNLANWMNLSVIAEGVETKEQVEFLSNIGCQFAQGYYYYKPQSANTFESIVKEGMQMDYIGINNKNVDPIRMKEILKNDIFSENLLRNMLGGIVLYDYYDGELKIVKMNDYYHRILVSHGIEVKDLNIAKALGNEYSRLQEMLEKAQDNYSHGAKDIFKYSDHNAQTYWFEMFVFYLRTQDEHKLFYGIIKNISEIQQLQQEKDAFINSSNDYVEKFIVKDRLLKRVHIHKAKHSKVHDLFPVAIHELANALKLIHEDDVERVQNFYLHASQWQNHEMIQFRAITKTKDIIYLEQEINFAHYENENKIYYCTTRNVTEIQNIKTELQYSNNIAGDILKIEISEDEFDVAYIGQGLSKFLPMQQEEYYALLKKQVNELLARPMTRLNILHSKEDMKKDYLLCIEKDDLKLWIDLRLSLFQEEKDKAIYIGLTTDVNKYKESEKDSDLSKHYLSQLTHIAGLELWELDVDTMTLKLFESNNNFIANSLGIYSDVQNMMNAFIDGGIVHEESIEAFTYFIKHLKEGYENLICQLHLLTPSKVDIWVELNAGSYRDFDGKVRILGSTKDITREKQEEAKNKQISKFLEGIEKQSSYSFRINLSKDKILSGKATNGIVYEDKIYTKYMNRSIDEMAHADYRERLLHFLDRDRILKEYNTRYVTTDSMEYLRLMGSEYRWVRIIYSILLMDQSDEIYAYMYVLDIHEEKQRELDLLKKAHMDSLTGLLNRSTAKTLINQKLKERDDRCTGAFMIIDIDNFKMVNDSFGHITGDQILIEYALKLKQQFRKNDTVCRLGGDEFVVMCCSINKDNIIKKANEVCKKVCQEYITDTETFEISVSIGIAMVPMHGNDFDTLYHNADIALYQAKQKGKKQFAIYQQED